MVAELPSQVQVYKYISSGDHVTILEHCLNNTNIEYEALRRVKGKLSFGPLLTTSQAQAIFPEIATEVQEHIGLESADKVGLITYHPFNEVQRLLLIGGGVISIEALLDGIYKLPINGELLVRELVVAALAMGVVGFGRFMSHGITSYYNPGKVRMEIGMRREKNSYNEIAHEYTHHFHSTKLAHVPYWKGATVFEGHAVAVARAVCTSISDKNDDQAYKFSSIKQAKDCLELAYLQVCRDREIDPKKSLVKKVVTDRAYPMDIGYAAFCIASEQKGATIIKDLFNDKRQRRLFR